jgi:hypothetical protein
MQYLNLMNDLKKADRCCREGILRAIHFNALACKTKVNISFKTDRKKDKYNPVPHLKQKKNSIPADVALASDAVRLQHFPGR